MGVRTRFLLPLLVLAAAGSPPAGWGAAPAPPPPSATPAVSDTSPAPPDTPLALSDTSRAALARRIWRRFPTVEVRAPLHDLLSNETAHLLPVGDPGALPVARLADVVRLQAGVVADGEEAHVRGGRAGELDQVLDGVRLNEPLRGRPMDVPLLALRSAELVSGGQDAEHAGALAGVLDLRSAEPGERWGTVARWATDAWSGARYDQYSARLGGPVRPLGLGVAAAVDATLDDTWLPSLRSNGHHELPGGISTGWRAENRLLGWLELTPAAAPRAVSLQVLASHELNQPYDPAWTVDGWTGMTPAGLEDYSPVEVPGYQRFRAADRLDVTDERRLAAILHATRTRQGGSSGLTLGWLGVSTVTSPGARRDAGYVNEWALPVFGSDELGTTDPFHVWDGYDPFFRRSGSGTWTLRADHLEARPGGRLTLKAGVGLTYEDVWLRQLDGASIGTGLDSLRAYHAFAPGGFAYVQTRWRFEGLVLNAGLRAQVFTAGPQAAKQTLPAGRDAWVSFSPRLGVAYPISTRDVLSLAYVRLAQDPARDFLYDSRRLIDNRHPLGNPALQPATVISYQLGVTHLLSRAWATQAAVFYRDVWGEVGARSFEMKPGVDRLRYTNDDEAHAVGVEWSLLGEPGEGRRFALHYTWMQAYGSESLAEGQLFGDLYAARTAPVGDYPLSWDVRHTIATSGEWRLPNGMSVSWATTAGSPLPWTPAARRELAPDPGLTNSRRLGWTETTDLGLRWRAWATPFTVGLDVLNLFDERFETATTVDGYPHPLINTVFDDYGAYRTETGHTGGAYWEDRDGDGLPGWKPVHDPRLSSPPRRVRVSLGVKW